MNYQTVIKINLLLSLTILWSGSCRTKEETIIFDPTYVIEGHLYVDCNMEPVSGLKLRLIQDWNNGSYTEKGGILDTFVTDSTGYFKFTFKDKGGFDLFIRYKAGYGSNVLIHNIPKKTSFLNLNLYLRPTVDIHVSLNVINPYTERDTLVIQDFKSIEGLRIPGPFKSGFVFKAEKVRLGSMSMSESYFYINWFLLPYSGNGNSDYYKIEDYCNIPVELTFDIE